MAIYMFVDTVAGGSTHRWFPDWFEIQSFSWGEGRMGNFVGSGSGTAKVVFQDFSVTKQAGKGSPKLFLYGANGKHIKRVEIAVTQSGGDEEIVWERFILSDAVVSSYQIGGDTGSLPNDSLSFNFARIEFQQAIVENGAVVYEKAFWDVKTNSGG